MRYCQQEQNCNYLISGKYKGKTIRFGLCFNLSFSKSVSLNLPDSVCIYLFHKTVSCIFKTTYWTRSAFILEDIFVFKIKIPKSDSHLNRDNNYDHVMSRQEMTSQLTKSYVLTSEFISKKAEKIDQATWKSDVKSITLNNCLF